MKRLMYKKSDAFSLFEVIVVLALITLTLSIGIFYWRSSKNNIVFMELERLYALCMLVHHRAQADGCSYTITIDPKTKTLSTPFFSETLAEGVEFGVLSGVRGPPGIPTDTLKKPITFVGSKIVCDPQGVIQPGTLYLTDSARSCLYALSVAVSQISYIRRYIYTNGWVLL